MVPAHGCAHGVIGVTTSVAVGSIARSCSTPGARKYDASAIRCAPAARSSATASATDGADPGRVAGAARQPGRPAERRGHRVDRGQRARIAAAGGGQHDRVRTGRAGDHRPADRSAARRRRSAATSSSVPPSSGAPSTGVTSIRAPRARAASTIAGMSIRAWYAGVSSIGTTTVPPARQPPEHLVEARRLEVEKGVRGRRDPGGRRRRHARSRVPSPPPADPDCRARRTTARTGHAACRPHSVLSNIAQRPARGSSPGAVRRVHGQQPTDA